MRSNYSGIAVLMLLPFIQASAQTKRGLDTTTFVVMGEGLAAGMANYGLSSVVQSQSFPAQMAAQMHTAFPQPLIEPPGIGDVVGYPKQDVRYPTYPQGAVRMFYQPNSANAPAPPVFVLNLSVPSLTLADSVSLAPVAPVIQTDMKQTVVNLILGFPQLFFNPQVNLWTQFQYAQAMNPTVAMIELGYYEALSAAVDGNPSEMPAPATFAATYQSIVAGLRGLQAQVIVTTIPNPIDTGYFNSPAAAASVVATPPSVLMSAYSISAQDYVTRNGLVSIANQFAAGSVGALPAGSLLPAATAATITANVNALNAQIVSVAQKNGAMVYDLNAFFHKIKVSGISVPVVIATGAASTQTLNGDYLGGFYSLDGIYPGPTGHALIANDILSFLNSTYQRSFPLVSVATVAAGDATIQIQKPTGDMYTAASVGTMTKERGRRP